MIQEKTQRKGKRAPRTPKKITAKYLENAALAYLARYASSAANLRRIMMRRIERSCAHHGSDVAEAVALLDAQIERYIKSGLLDDTAYARGRVNALRRQGASARLIQSKLRAKGLDSAAIDVALKTIEAETGTTDREAAKRLAQKRRIGPYRKIKTEDMDPEDYRNMYQKELAIMARAGFDYQISQAVLKVSLEEDF